MVRNQSPDASRLTFRLLGPLTVDRDGHDILINSAKLRTVLACLLTQARRLVTANALIDEVWDDKPPASAANTLQTYICQLRNLLEPCRQRGAEPKLLRTVSGGYVLDVEAEQLDSMLFERALAEGRAAWAAGDPDTAAEYLRAALSLWRGPALVNVAGMAVELEAARLNELRLVALELRIEADLACGRHGEVACEVGRLVREHPWRERFIGQLMIALYRCGRQAEALERYREARDRFVADLGISPGPELRQLEQRLLRQDALLQPDARVSPTSAAKAEPANVACAEPAATAVAAYPDGAPRRSGRRRLRRTGAAYAVVLALALSGIAAVWSGATANHFRSVPGRVDVVFNEFDLAVHPGVGYDLDIPKGKPSDWHATNNLRSSDYEYLDLYRTSRRAPEAENQISGVDVQGVNDFNAIHSVADTDPPSLCAGLPQRGGGNVKLRDLHLGARVCLRTRGGRWAMITVLRLPTDRAALLFVHVTVMAA
jgi:DNA-binding SARP family transcriptional activator